MGDPIKEVQSSVLAENRPIDKYFWFNLSRKWVTGGIQNIIDICERLKTAISWFFGLGTSGFFLSTIFGSDSLKGLDLTFMVIPLVLFFISYGLAVMGETISLSKEFKPDEDTSIRKAYNKMMVRSRWFIVGSALALMFALVSFPIIVKDAVETKQIQEKEILKSEFTIKGAYITIEERIKGQSIKAVKKIYVSGNMPGVKNARLIIEIGKTPAIRKLVDDSPILPDSMTGLFFLVMQMSKKIIVDGSDQIFVSIEFPSKDGTGLQSKIVAITETK